MSTFYALIAHSIYKPSSYLKCITMQQNWTTHPAFRCQILKQKYKTQHSSLNTSSILLLISFSELELKHPKWPPYHLSFLLPSKTWIDHPNMHHFEITKNSPLCSPCHNFESHSAHTTQWLKHSLHWSFNTTQQLKHSLQWSFNTTQRLKSSLHWSFLFPLQCKLELKIQCTSPFYNYEQSLCTSL